MHILFNKDKRQSKTKKKFQQNLYNFLGMIISIVIVSI